MGIWNPTSGCWHLSIGVFGCISLNGSLRSVTSVTGASFHFDNQIKVNNTDSSSYNSVQSVTPGCFSRI
jgi:hypothetical protein